MISYSSIRISGLDLMITGTSSNLTVLGTILGFDSVIALPTSELISIGNWFSSTPFSTCTMGLVGSGATSFRSESLLLDSGFFFDRVLPRSCPSNSTIRLVTGRTARGYSINYTLLLFEQFHPGMSFFQILNSG
jgi:hypothetical protein